FRESGRGQLGAHGRWRGKERTHRLVNDLDLVINPVGKRSWRAAWRRRRSIGLFSDRSERGARGPRNRPRAEPARDAPNARPGPAATSAGADGTPRSDGAARRSPDSAARFPG